MFPEASQLLNGTDDFKRSGGWMLAAAEAIVQNDTIELSVLSVSDKVEELTELQGQKIKYYVIPRCKRINGYEPFMVQVNERFQPDVVHIHGTEFPYGKKWIDVCPTDNVVVSIQGLISVIARYYRAGLTWWEIVRDVTFRDLMRKTILGEQREFYQRGRIETEIIGKVRHVIGRTTFDRAHSEAINPSVQYHFCNETLRPEFYKGSRWNYANCTKHSIFLSQATYPLKGLHQVLRALPIVLRQYPDVQLRIAGGNITSCDTLQNRLRRSGYGKIIRRMIDEYHLGGHVSFTGALNAEQMIQEYLISNLFICPSSIENSSNSLAEAQLLGVPCLSSYVGGLMDMVPTIVSGELYRFEETEMMAWKICHWFEKSASFDNSELVKLASQRHDPDANCNMLLNIYHQICQSKRY